MIIRKTEKRPGRPPNRSDETLVEIDAKERLAILEKQENPAQSCGPYSVVQIFSKKWQTRMHGPSHHTAYSNIATLSEAKRLGGQLLAAGYPTEAIQIHDMQLLQVVVTKSINDDSWTSNLRSGRF